MTLKEFRAELSIGSLKESDIYSIAEDENTPDEILHYLIQRGTDLPGFKYSNFSSIAKYTLLQKQRQ